MNGQKLIRELTGLFFVFCGLLILLSLWSYDVKDPTLNHTVSGGAAIKNSAGLFGACLAGLLTDIFGFASYLWALFFLGMGAGLMNRFFVLPWYRWIGYLLLSACLLTAAEAWNIGIKDVRGGGFLGAWLYARSDQVFSPAGSALVWFFALLAAMELSFRISWLALAGRGVRATADRMKRLPKAKLPSLSGRGKAESVFSAPPKAKPVSEKFKGLFSISFGRKKKEGGIIDIEPVRKESAEPSCPSVSSSVKTAPEQAEPVQDERPTAKTEKDSDSSSSREKEGTSTVGTASAEKTPQKKESKGLFGFLHGGGNGETAGEDARLPLPSLDLLTQSSKEESSQKPDQALLERKGAALMECLQNFGVTAELDHISPGPVITLFALRPAPGVKAGRFAPLSQDIAMSLKAEAVRVQAPIPGTDTVGVEVPNEKRAVVRFRDIIQNDAFRSAPSLLTLALGKDIAGAPRTDDLARMPHLLLAGATGAGKSVCLNAILLSLLYKARPDEVKLLLIDPKVVEFQVYDELPHLVHPVVSDMDLARNALMWAVDEMERRYVLLNELGVRKLDDFNRKVRTMEDPRSRKGEELSPLPYIVIVVDEFGDLILNKGKEIESAIARLGQKARAAGIHLILATQSPRADVVTGLIKANLPSRIAFRTSGPTESRIIIDQGGAEALLGNGDMLLKASNGKLHRLHGAYVSDAEVEAVVGHWKKLRSPDYKVDFRDYGEAGQDGSFSGERGEGAFDKNDVIDDPLYAEAVQFAREKGFVSISKLQQRYRIGFNKAARFVDQMEQDGLIGPPPPGGKPRQVIG